MWGVMRVSAAATNWCTHAVRDAQLGVTRGARSRTRVGPIDRVAVHYTSDVNELH